jgi:lipid A 3-O-deacylase
MHDGLRVVVVSLLLLWSSIARAQSGSRLSLTEENDGIISRDDRHYTQGSLWTYLSAPLSPESAWSDGFDAIGALLPMFRANAGMQRRVAWEIFGQSQFTPEETKRNPPDPRDRPYAAWLYMGIDWLQDNGDRLHDLDAQAGVVGPAALGSQMQNGFHRVFGFNRASAWDHQLGNRLALQFSYAYRQRIPLGDRDGFHFDVVPAAGLSLGTILRYAEAGGLLRFGDALNADYGPQRMRPALSGTAFADSDALASRYAFCFFLGAQARRVQYNYFIDGSSQLASPGLDRRPWVLDVLAGATLWLTPKMRADFTATQRSPEFAGQTKLDVYGAATLSLAL